MDLVRLLSMDGPVVGLGVVVALVWFGVTLTSVRTEVRDFKRAHEGTTQRLNKLSDDVSYLRGRQEERDRQVDTGRLLHAVDERLMMALGRRRPSTDDSRT